MFEGHMEQRQPAKRHKYHQHKGLFYLKKTHQNISSAHSLFFFLYDTRTESLTTMTLIKATVCHKNNDKLTITH